MQKIIKLIVLVFLVSCNEVTNSKDKLSIEPPVLTEKQKRKIFADSLAFKTETLPYGSDSPTIFQRFIRQYYPVQNSRLANDPFFYALEEPYIDTTKIDSSMLWFRITVEPCFRLPYCMVLEKISGRVYLTTKASNGSGCYNPGVLAYMSKFHINDTVFNNVLNKLDSLDFWNLGYDTTCHGGLDGETWIFEAIVNRKYNVIYRWYPQGCGNDTTLALGNIGTRLRKFSKFDKVMEVFKVRLE